MIQKWYQMYSFGMKSNLIMVSKKNGVNYF